MDQSAELLVSLAGLPRLDIRDGRARLARAPLAGDDDDDVQAVKVSLAYADKKLANAERKLAQLLEHIS